jgi:membrane-associated protease RseP (regulator of RpoE activity)
MHRPTTSIQTASDAPLQIASAPTMGGHELWSHHEPAQRAGCGNGTGRLTRGRLRRLVTAVALLATLVPLGAAAARGASSPSPSPSPSRWPSPDRRAYAEARRAAAVERLGKRGFLGVDLLDLTPELRRHFGGAEETGVLVSHVEPGSPAERAGMAVGDLLVRIEGKPVDSAWDLRDLVAPRKAGETINVEVVRDGHARTLQATLIEREAQMIDLGNWMHRDGETMKLVMPDGRSWQQFGEEMGRMGEEIGSSVARALDDPEVKVRIERQVRDRDQLQRKMDELERRMHELERRLQDQHRR